MRLYGQVTFFSSLFGYLGMFSIIYSYLSVLTTDVLNWCIFNLSLNVKYLLQSTAVNKWDSPGKWHSEFFLSFWISLLVFNNLLLSQSVNNGYFKFMYDPSITWSEIFITKQCCKQRQVTLYILTHKLDSFCLFHPWTIIATIFYSQNMSGKIHLKPLYEF